MLERQVLFARHINREHLESRLLKTNKQNNKLAKMCFSLESNNSTNNFINYFLLYSLMENSPKDELPYHCKVCFYFVLFSL